jgi:hypothetical protein
MKGIERTDFGAVAQADAGPPTQLRASCCDLGGATGLDARIFGLERCLVPGSLAYENGDLVNRAGRQTQQLRYLVARFLAARRAAVGSGRLMSGCKGIGITTRETAGTAVGTGKDGTDLVNQWITGNRKLFAEETESNTNKHTEDGRNDRCFEDNLHRGLT